MNGKKRSNAADTNVRWKQEWHTTVDPSTESCSPHVSHEPTQNPRRSTCGIYINSANPGGSLIVLVCLFILNASTFLWGFSFQKKAHTLKGAGFKALQKYYCWDSLVQHPENLFRLQNEAFIRQELPHTALGTHLKIVLLSVRVFFPLVTVSE